jgi:hypothetical protein
VPSENVSVVLVHGAWADGSSWMRASVRSLPVGHTPSVTAPDAVVALIREAMHEVATSRASRRK